MHGGWRHGGDCCQGDEPTYNTHYPPNLIPTSYQNPPSGVFYSIPPPQFQSSQQHYPTTLIPPQYQPSQQQQQIFFTPQVQPQPQPPPINPQYPPSQHYPQYVPTQMYPSSFGFPPPTTYQPPQPQFGPLTPPGSLQHPTQQQQPPQPPYSAPVTHQSIQSPPNSLQQQPLQQPQQAQQYPPTVFQVQQRLLSQSQPQTQQTQVLHHPFVTVTTTSAPEPPKYRCKNYDEVKYKITDLKQEIQSAFRGSDYKGKIFPTSINLVVPPSKIPFHLLRDQKTIGHCAANNARQ